MPLGYIQPTDGLARELREVAHDATALAAALQTGVNFELPPDFPKEQLLEIAGSLAQLPNGTAEGCRAALEYARNRLPAIWREHVLSEEIDLPADADAHPQVLRNSLIDERLRHLIASTTTALDEAASNAVSGGALGSHQRVKIGLCLRSPVVINQCGKIHVLKS